MPSLGFMLSQGFLQKLQIVGKNVKYKNISFWMEEELLTSDT